MWNRFDAVLSAHDVPALVALVARGDDVHVLARGAERDAIFRIASITKPVTAAAAMILVEECKLRLDQSVERWLPELADRRVLRSVDAELDDTLPARRAITVRDLLTSTMGIGSVMAPPDRYPIQRAIRELRIGGDGPKLQSQWPSTDEWLSNLGSLPLLAQPGERFYYNVSLDVLGVLIARVSGQSLGAFLRERVFDPLGMKDTAFSVPDETLDRLTTSYTDTLDVWDGVETSTWRMAPPPFESGSGGLVATIDDYYAFCRMLLMKGAPILSRPSVELMMSDQLTPAQREGAKIFFGRHSSWGFGAAVDIARREIFHTPGRYGWTGGFGTTAYTDPFERLIGILFTQRMMASPEPPAVMTDFWTLAYAAIR